MNLFKTRTKVLPRSLNTLIHPVSRCKRFLSLCSFSRCERLGERESLKKGADEGCKNILFMWKKERGHQGVRNIRRSTHFVRFVWEFSQAVFTIRKRIKGSRQNKTLPPPFQARPTISDLPSYPTWQWRGNKTRKSVGMLVVGRPTWNINFPANSLIFKRVVYMCTYI